LTSRNGNGSAVLRAEALTKSYGRRIVVQHVDLDIHTGEVVGLLGPNGAGKTTTFYMVVGLARPDSGQVFLDDDDITSLPMYMRARQGIGYLPQEASVFRRLSAEQNVLAVLESRGMPPGERHSRTRALLEELGITHIGRQPAYTLSGGERRRLEICRALATDPSFILLDEPFAGIDPIAVIDIQKIIAHLRDRGIGVLITDHNVRETLKITDRAYILREGAVFRSGTPEELASDEEVRRVYLGEAFRLDEPPPDA
jgi:lipopolysaccharide export system ATP-binding protein